MKNHSHAMSVILTALLCLQMLAQGVPSQCAAPSGGVPADVPLEVEQQSLSISMQGDAAAKKGDWPTAATLYRQALALWSDDINALYGMAEYSQAISDPAGAIRYDRAAIYTHPAPPTLPVIREPNAYPLMEYALRLSLAGQEQEAVTVYNYAAGLLNYQDGRQNIEVLLPQFGTAVGQWADTPHRLQAMAHVGYAIDYGSFDKVGCLKHLQQAVALAPDTPVTYFYRARHKYAYTSDHKGAREDYERARQLGDAVTSAAVDHAERFLR